MAFTKKVFIGSLFQFTNTASEEVLSSFRKQFTDETEAPFVSYNEKTRLFSCNVDPSDQNLIPLLNAQVNTYVTLHGNKSNSPFELERLIPVAGTVFQQVHDTEPRELEHNLLSGLDDSSGEEDNTHGKDSQICWRPECGDISILSTEIATEIANATGTFLIPDRVSQRVKLAQGNSQLALQKLQRMEKILTLTTAHRSSVTTRVNANRLFLNTGSDSALRFMRPAQTACGFDRIILNNEQFPICNDMLLTEIRLWKDGQRLKPLNLELDGVSLTASNHFSKVLDAADMPTLGDIRNREARSLQKESSRFSADAQHPASSTKFLGQRETERVEEWRGKVDPEAVPTLPPAEPIPEEEETTSRRRIVMDSDEESDCDSNSSASKQLQMNRASQKASQTVQPAATVRDQISTRTNSQQEEPTQGSRRVAGTARVLDSQAKNDPKAANARRHLQSTNMFDIIGENHDVAEAAESVSEQPLSERSNEGTKQLNVKFGEPDSDWNTVATTGRHLSSSNVCKPAAAALSPGSQSPLMPKPDAARQSLSQSHGRTSLPLASPGTRPMPVPMNAGETPSTPERDRTTRYLRGGYPSGGPILSSHRRDELIDVSTEKPSSDSVVPPPGFYYRSDSSSQTPGPALTPPQEPHRPNATYATAFRSTGSTTSFGTSGSAGAGSNELGFNPQYTVPRPNMQFLREQAAAGLRAQIEAETGSTGDGINSMPPNRIQKNDEYSTRKYRKTMSQKMAKPSKGKNLNKKQETKAEQQARIARAKAEAYGDTTSASVRRPKPASLDQISASTISGDITAKKRQIMKKNLATADLQQDALTESAIRDVATGLVEDLTPILEAARAFKGKVKIEVQLGQTLVLKTNRIDEGRLYTPKDWMQVLNGKSLTDSNVTFTNIVTQNGCDIDRMLETKAEASRLWSGSPVACSVEFEFSCQDKSGRGFVLVLDQEGNHSLNKEPSTIGQVAIHMPSQIWDACATVSGTMELLRPSKDVLLGVEQFKKSIYIRGGKEAVIYYRLPPNNAFTIKSIVVKRMSVHDCLLPCQTNIELRITEIKVLSHSTCPDDRKLYRSLENGFDVMVREGRLHYEVSIADKRVEKAFETNPTIEIGELAPITTENPDGKILNSVQAQGLVQITAYMLERIDWMGARNIGTLRRWLENAADQRVSIINTLPPDMNRNLAIPMGTTAPPATAPTIYPSQQSRVGGTVNNTGAPDLVARHLPGVRTNTAAELFQDRATGDLYYYGQGGARIPYINNEIEGLRPDGMGPVLPSDSASQVGDAKRRAVNNQQRFRSGIHEDKPAGFW